MREIKFRGRIAQGIENAGAWVYWGISGTDMIDVIDSETISQFIWLNDCDGEEIYEKDIIEFVDKWEWYRGQYGPKLLFADKDEKMKLLEEYENEPMERRVVEFDVGEGVNFSVYDLEQGRWKVIGNVYENKDLLEK